MFTVRLTAILRDGSVRDVVMAHVKATDSVGASNEAMRRFAIIEPLARINAVRWVRA